MGADGIGFLDSNQDDLFYFSSPLYQGTNTFSTADEPHQKFENKSNGSTFTWYRIGGLDRKENFTTFVAFKAPTTLPYVLESYIVIGCRVNWCWVCV